MYLYLIIIVGIGIAVNFLFILWSVLRRKKSERVIRLHDTSLTCEELEEHARKIAVEHDVSRKASLLNWPIPRMNENYNFIDSVYRELSEDIQKKHTAPPAAEWLLDNFYIIEEQV